MTDKEKAKAYDEALERAQKATRAGSDAAMDIVQYIFPQLAESEDERMLREIKRYIKEQGNKPTGLPNGTVAVSDMLTWLEKQKYNRMQPVYDNLDSFESALDKAWKSYNESGARTVDSCEDDYVECAHAKGFREGFLYGLEKQKEQKPAEYIKRNSKEWYSLLAEQYDKGFWKGKAEQKPEWSEEDEDFINMLILHFNYLINKGGDSVETYKSYIEKLKSLRPQPKAELTLLDENIIKAAVAFIEQNDHFNYWGGIDKHTVIKALRSLRPSWKPNE